jgi:hypothetical protein
MAEDLGYRATRLLQGVCQDGEVAEAAFAVEGLRELPHPAAVPRQPARVDPGEPV